MGMYFYNIDKPGEIGDDDPGGVACQYINCGDLNFLDYEDFKEFNKDYIVLKDGVSVNSVSYTHLDVYKRQALYGCVVALNLASRRLYWLFLISAYFAVAVFFAEIFNQIKTLERLKEEINQSKVCLLYTSGILKAILRQTLVHFY